MLSRLATLLPAPRHRRAATGVLEAGLACHRAGRLEDAARHYADAAALAPDNADAHHLLGVALLAQGDTQAAHAALSRAVTLRPAEAEFHFALGEAARGLGRLAEAIATFEAGLAGDDRDPRRHVQMADLYLADQRPCAAERHARVATARAPDWAGSWHALGEALRAQGRAREAVDCFERAARIDPPWAAPVHNTLLTLNYDDGAAADEVASRHRTLATRWHGTRPVFDRRSLAAALAGHRPLRVGLVSADFGHHVVSFFVEPLLRAHDPATMQLVCYFNGAHDARSAQLRTLADGWRDIRDLSDDDAAALVRGDALDVAVDLSGHTAGNRLGLFARGLAPVQATWLGYPNTTGVAAIDLRITDAQADPAGATEHLHTERLVRVAPGFLCYAPPPDAPAVAPLPATRRGHVTFGCFNNLAKMSDACLGLWARVLAAVPAARLCLKGRGLGEPAMREALASRFARVGGDPGRLTLLPATPGFAAHLACYGEVDVALDTYPYCGTTTTCEALWMGVPVVSLAGTTHAARVGASLLHLAGHPEWAARSPDDFVRIAATLAADTAALAAVRAGLRDALGSRPLTDAAAFAHGFENALRTTLAEAEARC
jgi:predicted O-linked N-acetylglucosamine transferase (SPINDLY family)